MTPEQIQERAAEIDAELAELATRDELDEQAEARFDELTDEVDGLAVAREKAEKRAAAVAKAESLAAAGHIMSGDGARAQGVVDKTKDKYDLTDVRMGNVSELRARALDAIEERGFDEMSDGQRELVTSILTRNDDSQGTIAKLILGTGSEAYKRGWMKQVTGNGHGLSQEERDALTRAASLTDGAGGFAIPFPIDPTLVVSGDGSSNPFRAISRVEKITTDSWQGLSAGAVSASWDGEAAEVSDDTPTWTQPSVPAYKAQAFVPASIEITQDYPNLAGDLAILLAQGKDDLEAAAFATGSGSDQPTGIVTAMTAGETDSATTDTFAAADVYTLFETLGPKYRSRSTWVANIGILNDIRAFGTADPNFTVDMTAAGIPTLLGRPVAEASGMDGVIDALADNRVLAVGDFSNYLIADRVGMSVEVIPHLFATANNLPSGQRGFYAHWRVGADSINDSAFELLNVT